MERHDLTTTPEKERGELEAGEVKNPSVSTFIHPIKCLACSLHFNVYSFHEDWSPRFCPECGSNNTFLAYPPKPSDHFIFEFVPGTFEGVPSVPPLPRMMEPN